MIASLAAVLVAALALATFAAYRRGIWIDEIWSLWMTRHDLPGGRPAFEWWLRDAHPTTFYAANWLIAPLVGDEIFGRRMLNLIWVAYLVAVGGVVFWKSPASRRFVSLFVLAVVTTKYFDLYFPEYRSYLMVLCAAAAQLCCLHALVSAPADIDWRKDRALVATTVVSTVLALNIHYVGTFIIAGGDGGVLLLLLFRRRYRAFGLLFAAGLLSAIPLGITLGFQLQFFRELGAPTWLQTTPKEAAVILAKMAARAAFANLVAAVCAGLGLVAAVRGRPRTIAAGPGAVDFAAAMAVGVGVVSIALVGISVFKPVLVDRYAIAIVALTAALVVSLAAQAIFSRGWVIALFCLNAVALAAVQVREPMQEARWADVPEHIQALVKACPETRVYAVVPDFLPPYMGSPDQPIVHDWGYMEVASHYGFTPSLLDPRKDHALARSARCPTVLWGEHMERSRTEPVLLKGEFIHDPQTREAVQHAKVYMGQRESFGFMLEVPPATELPLREAK